VRARFEVGAAVLHLEMRGTVDSREPGRAFDAYWTSTDDRLRREGVRHVHLDISGLEFMNSSGILTLVRWLTRAKSHAAYHVAIRYDRDVTWQHTCVPVLAKLAPDIVQVQPRDC
jgi:hypothetical protein